MMNWQWMIGGLLLVAPLVGGCAPSDQGPSVGNLGLNFADDWTGARAIDKASVDLSRGNLKGIEAAGAALNRRIEKGSRASFNIALTWMTARAAEAGQDAALASQSDTLTDRDEWRRESNHSYRAALAFLPSDTQKWRTLDPQLLNGLGYFLADQGSTRADFERAAQLTKLSYDLSPANSPENRVLRAQLAGDSYAWSLFRLGRTKDALQAQAQVMSILGVNSKTFGPIPADIAYHWGAICRVAGHEKDARDAFQYALTQNPNPELREILEINLASDDVV